jgi:hypothetical protein
MGPINKTIENDLIKLKHFSEQEKIVGYVNHLWFYGLRTKYPLEYLLYSQCNSKQTYFKNEAIELVSKRINSKVTAILKGKLTENRLIVLKGMLREIEEISNQIK